MNISMVPIKNNIRRNSKKLKVKVKAEAESIFTYFNIHFIEFSNNLIV